MRSALVIATYLAATFTACAAPPPPSPPPPKPMATASAPPVASASSTIPDAGNDAAVAPAAWAPPSPFAVIATAPVDAPFEVYPLASTTIAIAWADKPTALELEGDNLATLPSWLDDMGPFGSVNLTTDPLFPKTNPKHSGGDAFPGTVADDPAFTGQREITSIVGVSSSDAWAFVDRWGGERNVWVRSDAFRRAAGAWKKVASTSNLGVVYGAAAPWKGGALVAESSSAGERFVAFGAKADGAVPQPARIAGPCKLFHADALVPFASGELVAFGSCASRLGIQRWPLGAAQGNHQAFDLSFNSADPESFARAVSADEIELRVHGAVPGEEATDDPPLVDVSLRFKGGRWIATSTKRAPHDTLVAKISAASGGKEKPGVQSFQLRGARTLADGSALAWGEIRVDSKVTANVLLRSRAVASPVHVR